MNENLTFKELGTETDWLIRKEEYLIRVMRELSLTVAKQK